MFCENCQRGSNAVPVHKILADQLKWSCMSDYVWRPKGMPVKAQGIAVEPLLAFAKFVRPGLQNAGWIEDGSKVSDTAMSMREWMGLVLHAIALNDLTGNDLRVAKMLDNDDGGLVRGETEAVYVEQTLATHKNPNAETLEQEVADRIAAKSDKGENYAANRHLIVMINMNGDIDESRLAAIVGMGRFNIVNIIGFSDKQGRHYLSYLFDRDRKDQPIHRAAISEKDLLSAAARY